VLNEGETSRSWWFTNTTQDSYSSLDKPDTCSGLEESVKLVEKVWKEKGPFDGLMGFSQGACLVSLLASMSKMRTVQMKPRFYVFFSGFKSLCVAHSKHYTECIEVPSLHVYGETDAVITSERSKELTDRFVNPSIILHKGGHFVPGNTSLKNEYLCFFKKFM